ncbi:MAG TPA: hypothetical protein VGQ53_10010, partial [Chitinophagaceae bacterium]|nr:hypothetical protein [Chitinophagaceae bacterium]
NYVGLLEGEHGSSLQLQTINGVKFNDWFVGLGAGIDWYYRRSIPVFTSANWDFLKNKKRSFYLSGNIGINFPWQMDDYHNEWGYVETNSYDGLYWSAGLGYKIGMGKGNDALLIQLAYDYKHLGEKAGYPYMVEQDPNDRFDYHLRRLSAKIGWNF